MRSFIIHPVYLFTVAPLSISLQQPTDDYCCDTNKSSSQQRARSAHCGRGLIGCPVGRTACCRSVGRDLGNIRDSDVGVCHAFFTCEDLGRGLEGDIRTLSGKLANDSHIRNDGRLKGKAYVVKCCSSIADSHNLDTGILAINRLQSRWQLELWNTEIATTSDVPGGIICQGDVGIWVVSSEANVDEEIFPFMFEIEDDGTARQRPFGAVCGGSLVDICTLCLSVFNY